MSLTDYDHWSRLWQAAGCQGDPRPCHEQLLHSYAEPQRYYHNLHHITECLEAFAMARHLAAQPLAVEMAFWFHDAVYDSKALDNEARSASLARQDLFAAGASNSFIESVASLVLATKTHDPGMDPDAPLLVDVDLSIFGQSETRFQEYETQIRQEYSWVPAKTFATKRAEILEKFLGRNWIYTTDFFHNKLEERARRNIQWSLRMLKAMSV